MIKADELTRTYGDFVAVDKVSFSIDRSEIVGLLGHNGAGKTTIMKMLTGFLEPTAGRVEIDGLDPRQADPAVRMKIGYLPENCPVYPEMTVIEYLDYAAGLHGIPEPDRPGRIRETIIQTGLTSKATQLIATLSRGYRQRVGVAQAILHQPEILILDEPTNGLDPTQIQHMRSLIRKLASRSTVIISTHILQEVQAVCNRVMIIRNGEKAMDARLEELQIANRLLVTTDAGPDQLQQLLDDIPQLQSMEQLASGNQLNNYALDPAGEQDLQQAGAGIAQALVSAGYQLYALHREQRNLETLFGEITADEGRTAS